MNSNILLLAIVTYIVIITVGYLIDKYLRVPWMFTVIILSFVFSTFGLFQDTLHSENFQFLSKMGMLFFLFTIGVELELEKIKKLGGYIVAGSVLLTLIEGFALALFFYFVFPQFVSYSFIVALIAGVAFGTVGEVVLLAILKEFGLVHTQFGQLIMGIGVLDDIFEILALAGVIALPAFIHNGAVISSWSTPVAILLTLLGLIMAVVILVFISRWFKTNLEKITEHSFIGPFLIFLIIFSLFYFSSTRFDGMGVVAAIFSGIVIQQALPIQLVERYKKPIYFLGNIFLGPFFFLSIGSNMSFEAILTYPLVIVAIIVISIAVRVIVSYMMFNKILGKRQAAVLGIGLCTKFSTSVVTENLLMTSGLIAAPLYSAIMAAFILMKPIIIAIFSRNLSSIKGQIK